MLRLRPCAVCLSPLPDRLGRLWLARRPLGWAVFWAVLGLWSGLAQAADPGAAADDAKEWKPPEPEEQSVLTSDGLDLHYTYYAGVPNKSTAPIILLHAFKSDAASLRPTSLFLQELGHAVLAPDLRGHGRSVHGRADDGKPLKLKFTPGSASTSGTSVQFQLKVKKKAQPGTYTLTFAGKSQSGILHTAALALTVN